ncbi:hypothetical protein [Microbulbifer magnicolonia]|uniref:hypothetical protein n=1 Tax=Microbulbifer magnicolonia TaxID=3109744 RepID=UPI002B407C27|nr:hypothetical protein [Microbulbifer sp. GG15]
MLNGQTAYYRLDLSPERIITPDGREVKKGEVLVKGPGKFFFEIDLYTTKYFGVENDDIEKYLFGRIDTDGSAAVAALSSQNWMREIHDHILNYYEYMDAQRLRTPKGLSWLIGLVKPKNYNDLLIGMQKIRRMHCTMWVEASMEVVSAGNSDTKFVVTDNPVTLYNPAFYPGSKQCKFPHDPGIHLKGTRTIFPLDLNHCAILTNIEYARSPGKLKAGKPRTNPRYFDNTIANYDDIIRERDLDEQQVLAINYILKSRAKRYVAAARRDWLFPEKGLKKKDWATLDRVFISKSVKLLGRGKEIFIGGADGRLIATQDEFGRKPKSRKEWNEKEKQVQAMHDHVMKLLRREKESKKTSQ